MSEDKNSTQQTNENVSPQAVEQKTAIPQSISIVPKPGTSVSPQNVGDVPSVPPPPKDDK